MISKADLRDEMRAKYGTEILTADEGQLVLPGVEVERAFVMQAESGRTVITAPLREVASGNTGFTYLRGRLVGADEANGNGAFWTTEDLQLGEPTVTGGPLNWLHDDQHIIGCLTDGKLVFGREAAAAGVGNHLVSTAAVWRFLFPKETQTIEKAAADGQLYYSMECLSRAVACMDTPGRPGCGAEFDYSDYDAGRTCAHLRERSSVRRFVDPIFLGAAVVVPPVQPGWAGATADVVRQAAMATEKAHLDDGGLTKQQAVDLATAVLSWANRT